PEGLGGAVDLGRARWVGKRGRVDPYEAAELLVPAKAVDVEEHRPRGVREVGYMPAGELVGEPGVDRAEPRIARGLHVPQQPLDLRRREVGVDHEPRAPADE